MQHLWPLGLSSSPEAKVTLSDRTFFQDNLSTMALANNGRSNSDRTRHINIRYFFIKQYLENGVMTLQHCPATDIIADIITKPLQGHEFERLRDLLLGIEVDQFPATSSKN